MANAYSSQGYLDKAQQYYLEVLEVERASSTAFNLSLTLVNVAHTYLGMQNYQVAKSYLLESLELVKKHNLDCAYFGPLAGLGRLYLETQSYDSAKYYLQQAVEYASRCDQRANMSLSAIRLGQIHLDQGNWLKAREAFTKAFDLAVSIDDPYNQMQSSQGLYQVYKHYENHSKALEFHELFKRWGDSLYNKENTAHIAKLEANHEFEQEKERLVMEQEKEALILQNELKRKELIQYVYLAGILVFVLIAISFYISYRRKKRDHMLIQTQNEKLEELSKFKEGLTHMIAHDMKNALNTILGFSASDPYNKKMHNISQSGSLMLNLVTNMLDVQKFEETKVILNIRQHALIDLINDAKVQVELLLQMKSLRFRIEASDDLCLKCDSEVLTRVLVNLLTNAIKYSPAGKTISLTARRDSSKAETAIVSIADEGSGIGPSKLPFIFDKFWQADPKSSGSAASTGLGLTFCKLAVEEHNGFITVDSVVDEGTTFHVNLPCESTQTENSRRNDKPIIMEETGALILENEREVLSTYSEQLNALEVYQVGELNALLAELDEASIESLWKSDLRAAIYQGDEKTYKNLIGLLA